MGSLTYIYGEDTAATTSVDVGEFVGTDLTDVTAADIKPPDDDPVALTVVDADDPEDVDDDEMAVVDDTAVVLGTDVPAGTILVLAYDLLDDDDDGGATSTVSDERAL